MMLPSDEEKLVEKLHQEASERGEEYYVDPESGRMVFTQRFLTERGFCCETGCRHCPYGYEGESEQS